MSINTNTNNNRDQSAAALPNGYFSVSEEEKNLSLRGVKRTMKAISQKEGAGVTIRRTIGNPKLDTLTPFLLLDEFNSDNPSDYISGFPNHPHRGFETVTYMLEGNMRHKDSRGNSGLLKSGAVQWMRAGRGLVHSEMPEQVNGLMHGFQLWVNLPAKLKMSEPRYQDYQADQIPLVEIEDIKVKVIAGSYGGKTGPVNGVDTNPHFLDVTLPAGKAFLYKLPPAHTAFCYVVEGEGVFGSDSKNDRVGGSTIVIFEEGEAIRVRAWSEKSVRFLLIAAAPLDEPIARYGPFVMNTQQEIMQAFRDYQSGAFDK